MQAETKERTYRIRSSERCYRFKQEAFMNHAPSQRGIYELVTFDEQQNPKILYVGAAFKQGIRECLEGHAAGTMNPTEAELMAQFPNLYFDYLVEMDAKSVEDAQDIYWWLVQKNRPPYNDSSKIQHSGRFDTINVVEQ